MDELYLEYTCDVGYYSDDGEWNSFTDLHTDAYIDTRSFFFNSWSSKRKPTITLEASFTKEKAEEECEAAYGHLMLEVRMVQYNCQCEESNQIRIAGQSL